MANPNESALSYPFGDTLPAHGGKGQQTESGDDQQGKFHGAGAKVR